MKNKKLFYALVLFLIFQVYFIYKGVETVPFFNYGMFSEPLPALTIQEKYIIRLDGELFDLENSSDIYPLFIYKNLENYKNLKDPNYDDRVLNTIYKRFENRTSPATLGLLIEKIWNNEEAVKKFPIWLHRILSKRTDKEFQLVEFDVEYYTYDQNKYELIRTESILKHEH